MKPTQPPANRTHVVVVGLCMFALLVITVSLGGGCSTTPPPAKEAQAAPSPTPTGSPLVPPGDTPIIVKGGGSIDLDFSETVFTGTPPACTGCSIEKVELEQIKETGQPIPPTAVLTPCTYTGDPTVTIETQGNSDNVTVTGTSNTVKIDFPVLKYPGVINSCGDPRKFHSKDGEIKKVKVNGTECGGCAGNSKRCKVLITVKF